MTTTSETPAVEPVHRRLVLLVGGQDCLDRDCEQYFTEEGEPDPTVELCSHIRTEAICAGCSGRPNADGEYEHTVPWGQCNTEGGAV